MTKLATHLDGVVCGMCQCLKGQALNKDP
jgi:hypothetical protein